MNHEEDKADPGRPLGELEKEAIGYFISFVQVLGLPKSIGELYGLLFVSPEPIPMDVFITRLRMSKGGASQGLRLLRDLGAIKTVYVPGDRRDHYEADLELSRIASYFIKERLLPRLESGKMRIQRMRELAENSDDGVRESASDRLQSLEFWQEKGNEILPLLQELLVRE